MINKSNNTQIMYNGFCPYTNSLESLLEYPSLLEQPSKRAAYPMLGFF